MRFAVDAHAIGRHLTGNEVYVRSLLSAFPPGRTILPDRLRRDFETLAQRSVCTIDIS